ncbi:MAG: DNA polymerase/3'-5' exonuclease PolX [Phycisphaerae bacterium]
MPSNDAIARILHEMSQMMDILGEDSFRAAAHARAARAVESLSVDVAKLAVDKNQLRNLDGIGAKMADKIHEYVTTGAIREHGELLGRLPSGLLCLLEIQGLGPKTIRSLWQQAGVTDLASLEKAIDSGTLLAIPRMGQKSIDKLKQAIAFYKSQAGGAGEGAAARRLHLGIAMPIAERVVELLASAVPGVKIAFAGSLRRGKETIGDIDILAAPRDQAEADRLTQAFTTMPGVVSVLAAGGTRASVQVGLGDGLGRWGRDPSAAAAGVQMDLKLVPPESWGAAMMYFTGSKEHNVALRERARKKGLTLNEYGLFPEDDPDRKLEPPQKRGVAAVCKADTEESVYAALGLPYLPPECRENLGELASTTPPVLIEVADIKAELHAHTTASDGRLSIIELAEEAKSRGFHTIAVTDHSRSSAVAGGLSVERLLDHINAVRAAARQVTGITILAGSEVDILADGRLDYDDDILRMLDVVVASPHAALSQSPEVATARLLKAIENPFVHVLGHPTGRQINRRPGLSPDMQTLIAAAKERNVALEINTHWMRLDLRDAHARAAAAAGCLVALDSDVHDPSDFDNLRYGVMTARRGGVIASQCVNTWPADRLHAWLKSKR